MLKESTKEGCRSFRDADDLVRGVTKRCASDPAAASLLERQAHSFEEVAEFKGDLELADPSSAQGTVPG